MRIPLEIPVDANYKELQNVPPAVVALAVTYDTTVSSSTAIALNTATSLIEVTALTKGIFMKWGATVSSTSFDEFIVADSTRAYVVPTGQTSVQFIEEAASAKLIVIEK